MVGLAKSHIHILLQLKGTTPRKYNRFIKKNPIYCFFIEGSRTTKFRKQTNMLTSPVTQI